MAKTTSFFIIALLFIAICSATRPGPIVHDNVEARNEVKEEFKVEDRCNGVSEDECLTRRTLVAHLDYIYTQNHKP